MITHGAVFLQIAVRAALIILLLSIALSVYRIVRGPENSDRVIALDLLSVLVVALVVLLAIYADEGAFLDVAIAYALIAFLGTVALARYLERSKSASTQSDTREGG